MTATPKACTSDATSSISNLMERQCVGNFCTIAFLFHLSNIINATQPIFEPTFPIHVVAPKQT
jgi:hypothetical protein